MCLNVSFTTWLDASPESRRGGDGGLSCCLHMWLGLYSNHRGSPFFRLSYMDYLISILLYFQYQISFAVKFTQWGPFICPLAHYNSCFSSLPI